MCENGKGVVFGVGLAQLCRDRPNSVPFVVQRCTAEIEINSLAVVVRLTVPVPCRRGTYYQSQERS